LIDAPGAGGAGGENRKETGLPKSETQFRVGESGNRRGRPRIDPVLREVARAHTLEAVETLVQIMRTGKPADRLNAANALLDRAWGRPSRSISIHGDGKAGLMELLVTIDQSQQSEVPKAYGFDSA
jgi:hypothetical protein